MGRPWLLALTPSPCLARLAGPLATIRAGAVEDDVVPGDRVSRSPLELVDRVLELRVLEGLDLAAGVAHEVVMMLAAGMHGLVARDSRAEVDPLDEAFRREQVEHPIDARNPDATVGTAEAVEDLLGGQAAVFTGEELDDRTPRTAVSKTPSLQSGQRRFRPFALSGCRSHNSR